MEPEFRKQERGNVDLPEVEVVHKGTRMYTQPLEEESESEDSSSGTSPCSTVQAVQLLRTMTSRLSDAQLENCGVYLGHGILRFQFDASTRSKEMVPSLDNNATVGVC